MKKIDQIRKNLQDIMPLIEKEFYVKNLDIFGSNKDHESLSPAKDK